MSKFLSLFSDNIKSVYTCYDRVVLRGYLLWMFAPGSVINFLKSKGFKKYSNGVMRIFTDQLNAHIEKEASRHNIPIIWWPSIVNDRNASKGKKRKKRKKDKKKVSKLEYVFKRFGGNLIKKKGNFIICIIADMESAYTYACAS